MTKQGPETKLIKAMRLAGAAVYGDRLVLTKNHGSEFTEAGVSDLTGTLDGVFLACEVKAPESYGGSVMRALEKGPTVKQRLYIERINKAGGIGWFAASIEQFMDGLAYADRFAVYEWDKSGACGEDSHVFTFGSPDVCTQCGYHR